MNKTRLLPLLILLLLLPARLLAQEYGHFDLSKVMEVTEKDGQFRAEISFSYLDRVLQDLQSHAMDYPPRFDSVKVLGCGIDHTDHIAIGSTFNAHDERRPWLWPRLNVRNLWKKAPNDIAGCGEFPGFAHVNRASLLKISPLGRCWAASLRSAATWLLVNGPSSGS